MTPPLKFPTSPHRPPTGRPDLVKRGQVPLHLRWQVYTDWVRAERQSRWRGACVGCGRNVWADVNGDNDPRGPLGDNTLAAIAVPEDNDLPDYLPPARGGQRKLAACAICANDYESYKRIRSVGSARLREHGTAGLLDLMPLVWPDEPDERMPGPTRPEDTDEGTN